MLLLHIAHIPFCCFDSGRMEMRGVWDGEIRYLAEVVRMTYLFDEYSPAYRRDNGNC